MTEACLNFLAISEKKDFVAEERASAHQLVANVSPRVQLDFLPVLQQDIDDLVKQIEVLTWDNS